MHKQICAFFQVNSLNADINNIISDVRAQTII